MPKLEQYQEHYDKCVDTRLRKEFEWFIFNNKGKHYIHPEMKGENALQLFIDRAHVCGYMLGMKPYLIDETSCVWRINIGWRFEPIGKIPWANKKKLMDNKEKGISGRNPYKSVDTSILLHGFGIALNLTGWHIFMNGKYTYAQLQDLLDEGNSIEEIFDKSIMSCRNKMLVFNNNRLTTTEAVRQAGISMRWFNIKVAQEAKRQGMSSRKLPEELRQRIFDQIVIETKKTDEQGIICFRGKTWMLLSDEDASSIIKKANADKISPRELLHRIINEAEG